MNYQGLPSEGPEYNSFSGAGGSIIRAVEYHHHGEIFPSSYQEHAVPFARCITPRTGWT